MLLLSILLFGFLNAFVTATKTKTVSTTSTMSATSTSFVTPHPVTTTRYKTITPAKTPLYYTVTAIPSTSTVVTATVANINLGTGAFDYHFLQTKNFTMKLPTAVVPTN